MYNIASNFSGKENKRKQSKIVYLCVYLYTIFRLYFILYMYYNYFNILFNILLERVYFGFICTISMMFY